MSTTYITTALRRKIRQRAEDRCEYCHLHSDDATFTHEIDHIIAERHGGATDDNNLALACFLCNSNETLRGKPRCICWCFALEPRRLKASRTPKQEAGQAPRYYTLCE